MKDPYGIEIRIGSRVAYNYQGQVRLGTVVSIENFMSKREDAWPRAKIMIAEKTGQFTSRVSQGFNLVVLDPALEENYEMGFQDGRRMLIQDC